MLVSYSLLAVMVVGVPIELRLSQMAMENQNPQTPPASAIINAANTIRANASPTANATPSPVTEQTQNGIVSPPFNPNGGSIPPLEFDDDDLDSIFSELRNRRYATNKPVDSPVQPSPSFNPNGPKLNDLKFDSADYSDIAKHFETPKKSNESVEPAEEGIATASKSETGTDAPAGPNLGQIPSSDAELDFKADEVKDLMHQFAQNL